MWKYVFTIYNLSKNLTGGGCAFIVDLEEWKKKLNLPSQFQLHIISMKMFYFLLSKTPSM